MQEVVEVCWFESNSRFIAKKGNSHNMPDVLILGRSEIEELLSMSEALKKLNNLLD